MVRSLADLDLDRLIVFEPAVERVTPAIKLVLDREVGTVGVIRLTGKNAEPIRGIEPDVATIAHGGCCRQWMRPAVGRAGSDDTDAERGGGDVWARSCQKQVNRYQNALSRRRHSLSQKRRSRRCDQSAAHALIETPPHCRKQESPVLHTPVVPVSP